MITRHYVIATAGHVDHGKSALVEALTGTHPDRLPEEKSREITIDLGFAHFTLPWPDKKQNAPELLSISMVDVPGHEDFVRNMIAGLGSINLVLLVVAADDGWMRQTEEHFQILEYLGIQQLIVVVAKADLMGPDRALNQIQEKLRGSRFCGSRTIAISTRTGIGLADLKAAIAAVLASSKPQRDVGKPRLVIDRAFRLQGVGPVVTGTLTGGRIALNQPLFLQPGNFRTRMRSIQAHRNNVPTAEPGMRIGINVAELPKTISEADLRRGWTLTATVFDSSAVLDVSIERSARLNSSGSPAPPLRSGSTVYLHHGSGRYPAVIVLLNQSAVNPGQTVIAQLRLQMPLVAFVGDRFVIRDGSEQHTLAGGVILDPDASEHDFRTPTQQQLLAARARGPDDAVVCVESELVRRGPMTRSALLRKSAFGNQDIDEAIERLKNDKRIVERASIVADAATWRQFQNRAATIIDRAHREHSQSTGVDIAALRAELGELSTEAVDALIEDLCRNGFVRDGSHIRRESHRPALPAHLDNCARQILTLLTAKLLNPPTRTAVIRDADSSRAVKFLIEQGDVVELGSDLLLSRAAFAQARRQVVEHLSNRGPATASELREALQTSRRVAIPLLERLDRERVTRRIGDRRLLVAPAGSGKNND